MIVLLLLIPLAIAGRLKVGFLFIGPIGDGGSVFSHNQGRLALEKIPGVDTYYQENVPEAPPCKRIIENMINYGCTVIVGTSFGYMDYMVQMAKKYPKIKFLHCSGYKRLKNMSSYNGRIYQAFYLAGIIAGLKTQRNSIGYVAPYEIPEIIRGINAFTLGALSVNPQVTVRVKWVHTWYDPAKEKEAAKALLDEGADIIASYQETAGPLQAAENRCAWCFGMHTDMKSKAPKAYLTAPVWVWSKYYISQIKAIQAGRWQSSDYWGGLKSGTVKLAPYSDLVPETAKQKVLKAKKAIVNGTMKIFTGPIYDNTGDLRVKKGQVLTDQELLKIDWLVKGVIGSLPKRDFNY